MRKLKSLIMILLVGAFATSAMAKDPLKEFFKDKTKIDNPFELRDPFKAPPSKSDRSMSKAGYYMQGKGQYSNIEEVTFNSIADLRIVGVLIGKERRAMVQSGKAGKIVTIKEGTKIGEDGAELKAILPGGVIIVEKIVNVYGQEEYLETVIPISK